MATKLQEAIVLGLLEQWRLANKTQEATDKVLVAQRISAKQSRHDYEQTCIRFDVDFVKFAVENPS